MDKLTAAEILDLFDKAEKLNLTCSVMKNPASGYFKIYVEADWLADEWAFSSNIKVIVSGDGKDTSMGDYTFRQMAAELEERLDRCRRRKELLERLTDEEKDLLDLKD